MEKCVFLILIIILSACSPVEASSATDQFDPSPITHEYLVGDENCRPPCWK